MIFISLILILFAGCFGTIPDESPGYTSGTIEGIIAAPCCTTSDGPVTTPLQGVYPEYWCFYCKNPWSLQEEIEVVLTYGLDEIATTTTNKKGEYSFTNVPAGKNYVITAYCPDFDDERPLVKDVALEVVEGGSYDTKVTDLVSTSLGLVVDFIVTYSELTPEDIVLDEVIANKPNFYAFPKFKKLVEEVRRVLEGNCGNLNLDEDVQEALCDAAEEITDLDFGCGPGFTPPPPSPPDPCTGNNAPVINEVTLNGTPVSSPSSLDLVIGNSYTVVVNTRDDNILPKPANPLTYSLTITKGTDPSFNIDMGTNNTFTGTPLAADVGTYTVYVNVNDGCATTTWGPVTIEVHDECYNNTAPSLTMPDDDSVNPGGSYSWTVTASDDNIKDSLSFSLVSVVPTPTNSFSIDPSSGEISWNPTCDDIVNGADTTYLITVEVDDGCITVQGSFEITLLAEQCPGTVEGKICQHNGNGYGQAWAHFRNIETDVVYSAQGAPGSGNYSIDLPAGDYVLWADKHTGSQCPTSIGYDTSGGNPIQDPNGWICLTVSSGGMHYYDIWVNNSEGSHPGPCLQPPSDACE